MRRVMTGRRWPLRIAAGALAATIALAGCTASGSAHRSSSAAVPHSARGSATPIVAAPPPSTPAPSPSVTKTHAASTPPASSTAAARSHGGSGSDVTATARALPLGFSVGSATQVITVVASSTHSTTATLQAWQRSGSGWRAYGPSVPAWLGADGLSRHPSESLSATPIGSFTLTQAFGHDANPGTALPYLHTTPDDWWISQTTGAAAALYNTHQRCASSCPFNRGDPNEHLYYETPYYDYAVVIDYNTRNAPGGVHVGAGSAFFLHVTVGEPTAGCVSIPSSQLVRLMRWLSPAAHPRIVIGPTA